MSTFPILDVKNYWKNISDWITSASTHKPKVLNINSSGTEIFTSANPASVTVSGSNPSDGKTIGVGDVNAILTTYNGATYDRLRVGFNGVAYASLARTASPSSVTLPVYNCKYLMAVLNVSSAGASGNLVLKGRLYAPTSNKLINLISTPTITTPGVYTIAIGPGLVDTNTVITKATALMLPNPINLIVEHNGAESWTYSLEYFMGV